MADSNQPARTLPHISLWLRDLPYVGVLILILLGIAYTSLTRQPIARYWELLVPVLAVVCVGAGWHAAPERAARMKLIATQMAHWLAFLVGRSTDEASGAGETPQPSGSYVSPTRSSSVPRIATPNCRVRGCTTP